MNKHLVRRLAIEVIYRIAEELREQLQEVGWDNVDWDIVEAHASLLLELAQEPLA